FGTVQRHDGDPGFGSFERERFPCRWFGHVFAPSSVRRFRVVVVSWCDRSGFGGGLPYRTRAQPSVGAVGVDSPVTQDFGGVLSRTRRTTVHHCCRAAEPRRGGRLDKFVDLDEGSACDMMGM